MTKKMLIDATHPEETRVAVVDGTRLEEFDFEIASRRQIKSNIYLAKVTRVEPSLQAAFVEYGGNRHGFLPFPEIHPDYYRIPVGDRPIHDDEPEERWTDRPYMAPDPESSSDTVSGNSVQEDQSASDSEPEAVTHIEAASTSDFVISEDAPADSEHHDDEEHDEAEKAVSTSDGASVAENGVQSAEPAIDTVGGDEVEDAQRRRRTQMAHYKIQEVIKRRQIMLVQVSKEERGNKGAAVTTFLSLPGRYCVLMPNTARGGGVSRKIANPTDRKRMKELISDLEVPDGMSVILRTAGVERSKAEIKRDLEYLLRLWENIRSLTLESTAPALIYEEGNLIKRSIRDLYSKDIDSIEIAGEEGYKQAKDFMRMLMPSHAKRVQSYRDPSVPLFHRYQVESQIDLINNPVAHLRSGGYIVINQTEALVSIDVNSGRSTRERNIEETAVKTNLEAADEIARQLRLRDMGGLVVIDFIDMDEPRHDGQVERRLKEAMKNDRARIQVGRISPFGLLELSRQRMHPSLVETNFHTCPHCLGTGLIRSIESAALLVLRAIEEEGIKHRSAELQVTVAGNIALYILNQKRAMLADIEHRYGFSVRVMADDTLIAPEHRIERLKMKPPGSELPAALNLTDTMATLDPEDDIEDGEDEDSIDEGSNTHRPEHAAREPGEGEPRRKRRRNRRRRGRDGRPEDNLQGDGQPREVSAMPSWADEKPEMERTGEDQNGFSSEFSPAPENETAAEGAARRRRRGRRGGRGRSRRSEEGMTGALPPGGEENHTEQGYSERELNPSEPESGPILLVPMDEPQIENIIFAIEAPLSIVPAEPEPAVPAKRARTPRARKGAAKADPTVEDAPELNGALEASEAEPPKGMTSVVKPYEKVNEPPEEPRRGWWKRLVE
jgi:ribonuclease E